MKKQIKKANKSDSDPIVEKIIHAMNIHYRLLIEETIQANSYLIVSNDAGEIVRIEGDELKKQLEEFDEP